MCLLLFFPFFSYSFTKTSLDYSKSGELAFSLRSTFLKKASAFDHQSPAETLLSGPTVNVLVGLSNIADFEINWDILRFTKINSTYSSDVSDVSFFTKIKWFSETTFPSFGIKIGAKLPNASDETRVGTDLADTFVWAILGKHFEKLHLFGNVGIEILGDPKGGQDDALGYGMAVSYPFYKSIKGILDFSGRYFKENSLITQSSLRLGISTLYQNTQIDVGLSKGLIQQSEQWGITGGITKTFQIF